MAIHDNALLVMVRSATGNVFVLFHITVTFTDAVLFDGSISVMFPLMVAVFVKIVPETTEESKYHVIISEPDPPATTGNHMYVRVGV